MTYETAINKAWNELLELKPDNLISVKVMADEYTVDMQARKVFSLSCNIPAKEYISVLILHYLFKKLQGDIPKLSNQWLDFRELSGIEGYQAAFKRRVTDRIIRKYGDNPEGLLSVLDKCPGKRVSEADVGVVLEAFEGVPVLIQLWRKDEEFGPQANILFDKSVTKILCTEDIIVLAEFIVSYI